MIKKYYVYGTSTGEIFFCTSPQAADSFFKNYLPETGTAVWQGHQLADPETLVRVERGIYKKNREVF